MFAFGVFCVMAGVYYLLQDSAGFDRIMHGKSPKKREKQRSLEDFIVSMQRVRSPASFPESFLTCFIGLDSTRDHGIESSKKGGRQFCICGRHTFVFLVFFVSFKRVEILLGRRNGFPYCACLIYILSTIVK